LGIVQGTIEMFGTFAGFSMGFTATKHVAELREHEPARAVRIIGFSSLTAWFTGVLATLALLALSPWLATYALAAPHLTGLLRVSAVGLLLGAVNGAQTGALSGFEAFRSIAIVNLISGVLGFVFRVAGVVWFGLAGAVVGFVVSQACACFLSNRLLHREAERMHMTLSYVGCLQEAAMLLRFSIPAVLGGFVALPVNWLCSAMLVNQPGGYAQMGIFNAANQWFSALLFLPGLLGQVILPILSHRLKAADYSESRKVLSLALKVNSLVLLPLAVLALASKPLMRFYGHEFAAGWTTLVVVLGSAGFLSVQMPVGHLLAASGRMWTILVMNLGWAIAFILGTWLLIGRGALGMASSRLIAYALHAAWSFAYAYFALRAHSREALSNRPS
jgi:O-antigen/teichoic acid export membrane protein